MQISAIERDRKPGAFSSEVVSWGFRLKPTARSPGVVSVRSFKSRELALAAGDRMVEALRGMKGFSVRLSDGDRKEYGTSRPLVSWGYVIRTSARCGGVKASSFYNSPELADAASLRMVTSLRDAVEVGL